MTNRFSSPSWVDEWFNHVLEYESYASWKKQDDGRFALELDMPGVKRDQVKVNRKGDTLMIAWTDRKGVRWDHRANTSGLEDVHASLKDGLLTVSGRLPRSESSEITVE